MIAANQLSLHFGGRTLYDNISFTIHPNDKIGLVGRNGCGKSTLLSLLAGKENSSISYPSEIKIGYLKQYFTLDEDQTALDIAKSAFEEFNQLERSFVDMQKQLERTDMAEDAYMKLLEDFADVNDRLSLFSNVNPDQEASAVLLGLGFTEKDFEKQAKVFSGGWKMRLELARLLLQKNDVLFLDEPTNHLDINSIIWLERFLQTYDGAVVLVSHDISFLDAITNRTIEISGGQIYDYKFAYSKYIEQRLMEIEQQKRAQKNQTKEIAHTKELINKFRAKKNKAAFAQTLIRKLDKTELIEVDDIDETALNIRFQPVPHSGKVVVKAEHVSKSYGDKQVLHDVNLEIMKGEKVGLLGKNGIGKSTFLKMLVKEQSGEGELDLGHNVQYGYFAQNAGDMLDKGLTVFETIDNAALGDLRKAVRGMLGSFLFGRDDIDKKVSVLSGGEKSRLAFCKMLLDPINLLILDEPTHHLDMASKGVLKEALEEFDGTLLLVSHDRDFLSGLCDKVFELHENGMTEYLGGIDEFLNKQQADSIRDYANTLSDKKSSSVTGNSKEKVNHKEEKKLKNRFQKVETTISELEEEIQKKEAEMAEETNSDKLVKLSEKIGGLKGELEKAMVEWEELAEKVG